VIVTSHPTAYRSSASSLAGEDSAGIDFCSSQKSILARARGRCGRTIGRKAPTALPLKCSAIAAANKATVSGCGPITPIRPSGTFPPQGGSGSPLELGWTFLFSPSPLRGEGGRRPDGGDLAAIAVGPFRSICDHPALKGGRRENRRGGASPLLALLFGAALSVNGSHAFGQSGSRASDAADCSGFAAAISRLTKTAVRSSMDGLHNLAHPLGSRPVASDFSNSIVLNCTEKQTFDARVTVQTSDPMTMDFSSPMIGDIAEYFADESKSATSEAVAICLSRARKSKMPQTWSSPKLTISCTTSSTRESLTLQKRGTGS
jgi:hypothetical protein